MRQARLYQMSLVTDRVISLKRMRARLAPKTPSFMQARTDLGFSQISIVETA